MGSGAGTALILLAFVIGPSVVLGYLSWRAIENERSYSLERLRGSYGQLALLSSRQLEYQLQNAESRWITAFDDLLSAAPGVPTPERVTAFTGKEPLVSRYFILSAPGRIVYPPLPPSEEIAPAAMWVPGTDVREHDVFTRLVARGEMIEYEAGNPRAAIDAYREILNSVRNPRLLAMAESYIGRAQLKAGDRQAAIDTYRALLETYPNVRDLNRMYLRFLAQYQIASALDGLGRPAEALDVLLELHRDLQARSDAITTTQYSYYSELIQALAPRLLSQPGLADPARYVQAFRALGDRSKKHISDRYFLHLLEAELGDMSFRQKRYIPTIRYLSARAEGEPFLIAYRPLPDETGLYVTGVIAAQIDLARLQEQLSSAMSGLHTDSQSAVAILGSGGGAVIGQEATTGTLMATQDLAPPFDFWQVAVYLHDVPGAMKRFDLRRTAWLWLISLMLVSILFGGYVFIQRARRQSYLSRAQTTFVSNVTHELRTPLASIKMFAELLELQMGRGDGPQRFRASAEQHLRIIREECDRLNRLVDRVLDFSRMERNVKQYRFEAHPVGEVVERAVESFRPHADARGFSLQLALDSDLPVVLLDADAVSQVLLNLLTNAAQYSKDEKDIRVSVTRRREEVLIEVTDRGVGIDPRDQRRVFEKFYTSWQRMDSPTQGGLGLGLALSREIVRSHGGEITVRSQVGHGSTFTVTLPVPSARPVPAPVAPVTDLQPVERIGGRNA